LKGKNNSFKLRDTRSDIAEVCTILGLVESLTFYVIKNEESVINDPNLLKQLTIINNAVGDSSELLYTLLGQVDIHSDILDHTGEIYDE
jgi:hypothetical protein